MLPSKTISVVSKGKNQHHSMQKKPKKQKAKPNAAFNKEEYSLWRDRKMRRISKAPLSLKSYSML